MLAGLTPVLQPPPSAGKYTFSAPVNCALSVIPINCATDLPGFIFV